jgi:hypothetical protein
MVENRDYLWESGKKQKKNINNDSAKKRHNGMASGLAFATSSIMA